MSEAERDARLDAAWKAASRDEPPAALDAAIRAAAGQAVSARPRRARDKHWWYPLAAAATVAVIAVGLLQVTPPEQVAPMPDATRTMKQETVAVPAPPAAAVGSATTAAPPASTGVSEPAPLKKDLRASEGAGAASNAQNAQRERAAADKLEQPAGENAAANKPSRAQSSRPAPVQASSTPPAARRAEAFPGEPQPAAQSEGVARRDAETMAARPRPALPANEPATAPSSAAPPASDTLSGGRVEEGWPQRQAMLTANAAKVKTATPRSAEEWIKLIRQLRSEGRIDQASKELVAFRSAYGERADSLLPQDLREFETRTTAPAAK